MHYYYSVYSKEYIHKGLVLYNSMKRHDKDFTFFLICLDEETKLLLERMHLDEMVLISVKDIEAYDCEILKVKSWHQDKSYTWLVKAIGAMYIFDSFNDLDHLLWLDGDTQFLADPQAIYDDWGNYSILLSEEKFTDDYFIYSELYGYYNTGLLGFKKDANAIECLKYYREKLLVCNFDDYKGSWNDQLYVTDWPQRFNNVGVVSSIGINLTPFITYYRNNIEKGWLISRKGDEFFLHDNKIVLYHFMALKYINNGEYDLCNYVMDFNDETIKHVYMQYLLECNEAIKKIRNIDNSFIQPGKTAGRFIRNYFNIAANINESTFNICTIVNEEILAKSIALYSSLSCCCKDFCLWLCCTDDRSIEILTLMNLDSAVIIDIKNLGYSNGKTDIESGTQPVVNNFTLLKPMLIYYILKNNYNIQCLLYADNDFFFYSSPENVFQKYTNPITVFEEADNKKNLKTYSCYNSKLMFFRRTEKTFKWLLLALDESKQADKKIKLGWYNKRLYEIRSINGAYIYDSMIKLKGSKLSIRKNKIYNGRKKLSIINFEDVEASENILSQLDAKIRSDVDPVISKRICEPYAAAVAEALNRIKLLYSDTTC
jgi:hypothetical protein